MPPSMGTVYSLGSAWVQLKGTYSHSMPTRSVPSPRAGKAANSISRDRATANVFFIIISSFEIEKLRGGHDASQHERTKSPSFSYE